jgi:hypothetical protein
MASSDPIAIIRQGPELMVLMKRPMVNMQVYGVYRKPKPTQNDWEFGDMIELLPVGTFKLTHIEEGQNVIVFSTLSQVVLYFMKERASFIHNVDLWREDANSPRRTEHIVLFKTRLARRNYNFSALPEVLRDVRLRPPGTLRSTGLHVPVTMARVNYNAAQTRFHSQAMQID